MGLLFRVAHLLLAGALALVLASSAAAAESPQTIVIHLKGLPAEAGGRLFLLIQRVSDEGTRRGFVPVLLASNITPDRYVFAMDIAPANRRDEISVKVEDLQAFPESVAKLPPGRYYVQPFLDVNRNFAFRPFADEGDLYGDVTAVELPQQRMELSLKGVWGARPDPLKGWPEREPETGGDPATRVRYEESRNLSSYVQRVEMPSRRLSAFKRAPTPISAYVVLPPNYERCRGKFPVMFRFGGFGLGLDGAFESVRDVYRDMVAGRAPPMVWVFAEHATNLGTHEFADSANHGPWGTAFVKEFVPWLERRFPISPTPMSRFLTGGSSGGWAALWLQVRYPRDFGGAWAVAPDPVDFHEFTNTDIYASGANVYRDAAGTPTPLNRSRGRVIYTFEQKARYEEVLGRDGGQLASFDWVFSPRGPDGRPLPLFDWSTGDVDPKVAAYWRENYDIGHIVDRDGDRLRRDLNGKIRMIVGDADNYYLDAGVRRLASVLAAENIAADTRILPGRDHLSVYANGASNGLWAVVATEASAAAKAHVSSGCAPAS